MSLVTALGRGSADPAGLPTGWTPPVPPAARPDSDWVSMTFRAMACDVTLRVIAPGAGAEEACERARLVFERVEDACTRFRPDSPLMRANAFGWRWCEVPQECYDAVAEAAQAHLDTRGLFDPRVLTALSSLGYDRSLPFDAGPVQVPAPEQAPDAGGPPAAAPRNTHRARWRPGLYPQRRGVRIGADPIDLGGIGKGLAVRWAARELAGSGAAYLVEAGGDCYLGGAGPEGAGWHVGVEDPRSGPDPVAVLSITDGGCATSSTRVRRWQTGGRAVHHLIDPRTGTSAAGGLASVTVVGADPARAEVWSKALFVAGASRIAQLCRRHDLAALWVASDGSFAMSPQLYRYVLWTAPRTAPGAVR